jgi:2-polyprenyl-3-methyl-5-hydroxy-6-metoxy-1,4-benzoquinol methylase
MSVQAPRFDADYYARAETTKDDRAAARYVDLLRRHAPSGGRVLDVGCGTGAVLAKLAAEPTWECEGVDVSEEAVREAAAFATAARADAADLPFQAGEFDALLLLDVLEHTDSPRHVLQEARRVTRDGGVLIVSTPNAGSPLRIVLGKRWHGLADETHVYFFTRFTLEQLLRASGWAPIAHHTFSSAPWGLGTAFEHTRIGSELCVVGRPT